jgi:hypothetical protein
MSGEHIKNDATTASSSDSSTRENAIEASITSLNADRNSLILSFSIASSPILKANLLYQAYTTNTPQRRTSKPRTTKVLLHLAALNSFPHPKRSSEPPAILPNEIASTDFHIVLNGVGDLLLVLKTIADMQKRLTI